jgi:hypothetical protein
LFDVCRTVSRSFDTTDDVDRATTNERTNERACDDTVRSIGRDASEQWNGRQANARLNKEQTRWIRWRHHSVCSIRCSRMVNMPKSRSLTSSTLTKKSSTRKTKDPDAPKRYRTAYLLFSADKRNEVKVMLDERLLVLSSYRRWIFAFV